MDLPQEVSAFLKRRSDCAHWGGEDPYDAARARQIAAAVKQLGCDRLDADEKRLLKRYEGAPLIRQAIDSAREAGD